jgi:hypothetical protein
MLMNDSGSLVARLHLMEMFGLPWPARPFQCWERSSFTSPQPHFPALEPGSPSLRPTPWPWRTQCSALRCNWSAHGYDELPFDVSQITVYQTTPSSFSPVYSCLYLDTVLVGVLDVHFSTVMR